VSQPLEVLRRCKPHSSTRSMMPVATELGVEDAVFREEVGDDLWLVTLEPVSNHGHQELEDHRRSSAWRQ
jgi:hypothetical protein